MFRLLRYFSITSLILMVTAAVALGTWYRHIAIGDLLQIGERSNVALSNVLSNALHANYAPLLETGTGTTEPLAHAQRLETLRAALMQYAKGMSLVKVKIYSINGKTVFSSDASQIGEDRRNNPGFQRALSGQPASELVRRDTFSAFEQTIVNRDLLSSYIPVWRGQSQEVHAVFEIYDDVTPLLAQVAMTQTRITIGLFFVFSCIYGILFLIVRHADRILQRQHQDRLQVAVEAAGMTDWEWDVATDQTRWGHQHEQLLGPLPSGASRYPDFRDMVHPDDRDRFLAAGRATLHQGAPYDVEFRLLRTDGALRWLRHTGRAIRRPDGSAEAMIGVTQDITERRDIALELAISQQRRDALMESLPALAWMQDREGRFTAVNRAWCRHHQLEPGDVIGRTGHEVLPQVLAELSAGEDQSAIRSKSEQRFEHERLVNGEQRWTETVKTPIIDKNGEVSGLVGVAYDITRSKQAETALREMNENLERLIAERTQALQVSEERFRQVAEAAGGYVWDLDLDCQFSYLSARVENVFGYTPQEMVGRKPTEFMPAGEEARVNDWLLQNRRADGSFHNLEYRSIDKSGRVFWQSVAMVPRYAADGMLKGTRGSAVDITERKLAEIALQESKIQLQAILSATADGILAVDRAGKVIQTNQRFVQLWRIPPSIVDSRDDQALLSYVLGQLKEPEAFLERVQSLYESDVESTDTIYFKDGRVFERYTAPLLLNDSIFGRVWSFRDITHRVRADATRTQLEAQLRESQKMEAIGTLAGGVAHDFNNILPAIFGNLELARQDIGPKHPALISLNEIFKASTRAKSLVQQILAFSRRQATEKRVIELPPVVTEVVRLLRAAMPAQVGISAHFADDLPRILADSTHIHQVLMNVCTNAWHATEGNPGQIDIRVDAVNLDTQSTLSHLRPGPYVRISVQDDGAGMDMDTQRQIFDPFFTTKPVGRGTGLGLSVAHTIVKDHEGGIVVQSQPGKGTVLEIYFPAVASKATEDAAPVAVPHAQSQIGKHVLYIDDDDMLVEMFTNLLERSGYKVTACVDAAKALETLRANTAAFDLVITDYNMPGMSGLDLARAVMAARKNLPVVITSGYVTDELRETALKIGVKKIIEKANSIEKFLRELEDTLANTSTFESESPSDLPLRG